MSDFYSYCENHLIKVFQYKYIQKQIWPCHKVDQGQPRIIGQTYIPRAWDGSGEDFNFKSSSKQKKLTFNCLLRDIKGSSITIGVAFMKSVGIQTRSSTFWFWR